MCRIAVFSFFQSWIRKSVCGRQNYSTESGISVEQQFSLSLGKVLKHKHIDFVTRMRKMIQSSVFKIRC